jgi:hypothetical protein
LIFKKKRLRRKRPVNKMKTQAELGQRKKRKRRERKKRKLWIHKTMYKPKKLMMFEMKVKTLT